MYFCHKIDQKHIDKWVGGEQKLIEMKREIM